MTPTPDFLLPGAIGAALFLTLLWVLQIHTRDAGISDFGWAASSAASRSSTRSRST